jgi:hypothetical protein
MTNPNAPGIDPNKPKTDAEKLQKSEQDAIDAKNPDKKNPTPPVPPKR